MAQRATAEASEEAGQSMLPINPIKGEFYLGRLE
jgi:hypothetical protein